MLAPAASPPPGGPSPPRPQRGRARGGATGGSRVGKKLGEGWGRRERGAVKPPRPEGRRKMENARGRLEGLVTAVTADVAPPTGRS